MRSQQLFAARFVPHFLSLSLAVSVAACGGGSKDDDEDAGNGDPMDSGAQGTPDAGVADADPGNPTREDGSVVPPPPGCGDGVRPKDSEEQCDDGANVSGDGCSDRCTLEEGFNCPPMGGACVAKCGDGIIVGGEKCDDGDTEAGDGCSAMCEVESGWGCPVAGQACEPALCGDSIEVGNEQCDDGDGDNGDGCSSTCQIEAGWTCAGGSCAPALCGDGIRVGTEVCDDMNTAIGDGCDATCTAIEPFYRCPTQGGACAKYTRCGDGIFTTDEQCDDGNNTSNDGCRADCQLVETGYTCTGGTQCAPVCGDGLIRGTETCDDGGNAAPGCSATCQLEPGYNCAAAGQACVTEQCGNGVARGLEQCDDGNSVPFDGCFECKNEASCTPGQACTARCGDGIKFPSEPCDDGNTRNGDGCSATCQLETGFTCEVKESATPNCVNLPVIYRDFKSSGVSGGHPDFQRGSGDGSGLVRDTLGWDLNNDGALDSPAPTNAGPATVVKNGNAGTTTITSAASFNAWYRNDGVNGANAYVRTIIDTMELCKPTPSSGTYVFDDRTFYPLDNRGWATPNTPGFQGHIGTDSSASSDGCTPSALNTGDADAGRSHNYGFTSELRFQFTFSGGESLRFVGDDDVWVFIAGRRVIDLGGVHCMQSNTVRLRSNGTAHIDTDNDGVVDSGEAEPNLGLVVGNVYEVVVFQAERQTNESSYRLELGQFLRRYSECRSICGDGVRQADELCDDGGLCAGGANDGQACATNASGACPGGTCQSLNTGAYGRCGSDCKSRGPFCGDGAPQAPQEACDLGAASNTGGYGMGKCNPDCSAAPFCGDSMLNASFGENCDQGASNANGMYGICSTTCTLGPRCGDGMIQMPQEQCDDRINKSPYTGCGPGCKLAPYCGDGIVQANQGEQCDLGKDAQGVSLNVGGYGGCSSTCKRGSYCGDGKLDPQEECDDGNVNSYDGCSDACFAENILL